MRRQKSKVLAAIEADFERSTMPTIKALCDGTYAAQQQNCMVDMYTGWLVHSIMNPKQFEEFFWVHWKKMLDEVIANDKTIYIYMESDMYRFADYLQDIPKGHVVIHPELDDVMELRKKLPNICIAGGMKTELLGHGTPDECVDYAKMIIDNMGDGFIFSQDKMISFPNDCTRENLLAVNEFVSNYRV